MTHTHTGYRPHVGHVHCGSRLHGHRLPKEGATHALTDGPVELTALCGERVAADTHDEFGFRIEGGPKNVKPVGVLAVTCRRCLRILEQP